MASRQIQATIVVLRTPQRDCTLVSLEYRILDHVASYQIRKSQLRMTEGYDCMMSNADGSKDGKGGMSASTGRENWGERGASEPLNSKRAGPASRLAQ